jgi:hypothetical protein
VIGVSFIEYREPKIIGGILAAQVLAMAFQR